MEPPKPAEPPPPSPAPTTLTGVALERWRVIESQLPAGFDRNLATTYCQVYARWAEAEDGIARTGQLVKAGGGRVVANPLVHIAAQALQQLKTLEASLGLRLARADSKEPQAEATPEGWRLVNRVQLAALLGVHVDTVSEYSRAGMPVHEAAGRGRESVYDAVACLNWWRQGHGKNAKESAQTRAFNAAAELNELKLQREQAELLPRDEVIRDGQAYTKAWANSVRAIARRARQAGIVETADAEAALDELCRQLLTDIASWKTRGDAERAAKKGVAA